MTITNNAPPPPSYLVATSSAMNNQEGGPSNQDIHFTSGAGVVSPNHFSVTDPRFVVLANTNNPTGNHESVDDDTATLINYTGNGPTHTPHRLEQVSDHIYETLRIFEYRVLTSKNTQGVHDIRSHTGKLSTVYTLDFLRGIETMLCPSPPLLTAATALPGQGEGVLRALEALFLAIPNLNPGKDGQSTGENERLVAIMMTHMVVRRVITKKPDVLNRDQMTALAKAAATLAAEMKGDRTEHKRTWKGEYNRRTLGVMKAIMRTAPVVPRKIKSIPVDSPVAQKARNAASVAAKGITFPLATTAAVVTWLTSPLTTAPISLFGDLAVPDKPVNHALRLLTMIIQHMPQEPLSPELYVAAKNAIDFDKEKNSTRAKDLNQELLKRGVAGGEET
jgi:hypothetical protein